MPTQLELPVFKVEKYGTVGAGKVTCPREDCGKQFIVHIAGWYKPRRYTDHKDRTYVITGRTCPYCSRAAALPPRRGIR
jgi:hypothetical protein